MDELGERRMRSWWIRAILYYTSDRALLHFTSLMAGFVAMAGRLEVHVQACKEWWLFVRTHGTK